MRRDGGDGSGSGGSGRKKTEVEDATEAEVEEFEEEGGRKGGVAAAVAAVAAAAPAAEGGGMPAEGRRACLCSMAGRWPSRGCPPFGQRQPPHSHVKALKGTLKGALSVVTPTRWPSRGWPPLASASRCQLPT